MTHDPITNVRHHDHRPPAETRTAVADSADSGLRSTLAALACLLLAVALVATPDGVRAQEHEHEHPGEHSHTGDGHHAGLHFTHPLFAESVSPDRKVRLNYGYFDLPEAGEEEHSASLGLEYSFSRSFSVEASFPYSFTDEAAGITEVALKFANFSLEEHGLLLGYGLATGIPTSGAAEGGHGHDHQDHAHRGQGDRSTAGQTGSVSIPKGIPGPALDGGGGAVHATLGRDHWELSPFFNVGFKSGAWELVGVGSFDIPTGDPPEDDEGVGISYNASVLYHAGSRIDLLAELHGRGGIQGHPVGEDVVNVAPGIRWKVLPDRPLVLGLAASFPVSHREDYDGRILASLFYHFGG